MRGKIPKGISCRIPTVTLIGDVLRGNPQLYIKNMSDDYRNLSNSVNIPEGKLEEFLNILYNFEMFWFLVKFSEV